MIDLICACNDLGVHVDGSDSGPIYISNKITSDKIKERHIIKKDNVIKEKNHNNLRKNINGVNKFTNNLFMQVSKTLDNNHFPITLGGDHTVAIGSILAARKKYEDLGIIWIDAHADFNTFETTETGNLHGLPVASVCGLCQDLTNFITDKYIEPNKCVIVGARSIDKNEYLNLKKHGVKFFSTNDLKEEGINNIMNKAFEIAGDKIHISYDLDVIDPEIAKGVSIPEKNGITTDEALQIIEFINNKKDKITSFDLVEYNPSLDYNDETLNLAVSLLNKFIN